MAIDKAIDSAQLDKEMLATANAIRTKGGTAGAIPWEKDTGYEQAVLAIKSGMELNFEVVGSTSKPSSPKENTIWVNTSTEITGWAFSTEEPASPVSGMVWFISAPMGDIYYNALKENEIQIYPLGAQQYVNGAWATLTASIYKDGKWFYLFADFVVDGVLNADFTKDQSANTITQEDGYVAFVTGNNTTGIFTVTNAIDLTHFKTLSIEILDAKSYYRAGKCPLMCIGKNRPYSTNSSASITNIDSYTHFVTSTAVGEIDGFSGEFILDVSDFSGYYYVGFSIQGVTGKSYYANVKNFRLR